MADIAIAIGTSVIRFHRGDITMLGRPVGAIVNPANEDLRPGPGICGLIHEFGGPDIAVECLWIGRIAVGRATATTAGRLLADWVIHAVGPVWQGGFMEEDKLLASAYRNSLEIAGEKNLRSIAFPSISTGIFAYPLDRAAAVAIGTSAAYLRRSTGVEEIVLVAATDEEYDAYERAADRWQRLQQARASQAQVAAS